MLAQLNQRASRCLGVNESDVQALSALAGSLVKNSTFFVLNLLQCVSNTIFNAECDVLDTATTTVLLNKLGNSTLRACGLKKFNLCLANLEEGSAHVLILNPLTCISLYPHDYIVERYSLVQTCHSATNPFAV